MLCDQTVILNLIEKHASRTVRIEPIRAVYSEENYVPQPSSFVGYIENYGIKLRDHLSNNILCAEMVIGQNGYGPKWSWTEMVMGRNYPEPLYNMSRDVRK